MNRLGGALAPVAIIAVWAAGAAPASAAQRYASPSGSALNPCSQLAPCDLKTAVEGAGNGDEIIVNPGTYTPSGNVFSPNVSVISIHGAVGQPRPLIQFTGSNGMNVYAESDTVTDLDVVGPGVPALLATVNGGTVERVAVHATAEKGEACFSRKSLWRDSVCWASGSNAVAFNALQNFAGSETTTLRNMTIEAPATGSTALLAHAFEAGRKLTVNTFNTITRGASDIKAETDSTAGTSATVNVSRGNWSSASLEGAQTAVNDDGTKQAAPPVLVNPAAGDFREAETSPTIDAGADASANGTSDFEGDPRIAGLRTDIGADEFETNPAASTAGATSVTMTTATLNGAVNPNTIATSYHFEFGRTLAYGQSTAQTPAGAALQSVSAVSAAIAGLATGVSYHARLVATNAGGTVGGNDIMFTTLAPLPPAPARPTVSGAHLTNKRFRVARQNTAISARGSLGTIFRFTLSAGAKVEIAIMRPAPGLHHGHGCVAPTAQLRRKHAKRCTRALTVGTLTRAKETRGPDSVSFSGRIGHRALPPLAYKAILSASDAGGRSAPVTLAFAVLPTR